MTRTPEEADAEIERLLTLNDRLSRQLIGMSDRLQESARQIAADAWDACAKLPARPDLKDNPYRQPAETLGNDS